MASISPIAAGPTLSEQLADFFSTFTLDHVSPRALEIAELDLIDATGLCIAARNTEYVRQIVGGWDSEGSCTAFGHSRTFDAAGAAVVNGLGIHGEDFDDTLEGAPIRVGAMVIPAVLAICERFGLSGEQALLGIVAGMESVCRINHVAPGAIHSAGFHPVSVVGTIGAAIGAGTALGLTRDQLSTAAGISGSFSSGILEYLTDGAWTKRLHPGWAAQSGLRAAILARTNFYGPRTVFEGAHSFFNAFAPSAKPDYSHLHRGLGEDWYMERVVFKPYACGTMIHPYIDCMIRLRNLGIDGGEIESVVCETGEGLVHRLWEPLDAKHAPGSGYAAKFSMPYCMAIGFLEGDAGLEQFTDEKAHAEHVLQLARKITYVIDPDNEYPRNYTGHIRVTLHNGAVHELRQPHIRGGMHEPLSRDEIVAKFRANISYGGWSPALGERLLSFCTDLASLPDLGILSKFRV